MNRISGAHAASPVETRPTHRRTPLAAPFAAPFAAAATLTVVLTSGAALGQNQSDLGITTPPPPAAVESAPIQDAPTPTGRPTNSPWGGPEAAGDDPLGDAGERAAEDWRVMTGGAENIWRQVSDVFGQMAGAMNAGVAALFAAAAIGAYLGARAGGRRRSARAETERASERPEPERARAPRPSAERGPIEPMLSADHDHGGGEDAERLLEFFRERFNVDARNADGAIQYLTRLDDSIETMKRKVAAAERELESARASSTRNGAHPASAAHAAPWDLIAEAGRAIRAAGQTLRPDPDYAALARETQIEESLRALAALRAAFAERETPIEAEIVEEAWPHQLFRAEALALAYYPVTDAWRDLRFGLTAAGSAMRMLLRREGVLIDHVRLLSPLEPGEAEIWSDTSEGLRELAPVRRTVLANARPDIGSDAFVIDCENFGYVDREREVRVRSKVIVFNRAEWR